MEQNNNSLKNNKVFKIMILFYQILFLLSGLDLGFFRFKIMLVKLVKLYSFIFCIFFNVLLFTSGNILNENFYVTGWFILMITRYDLLMLRVIFVKDGSPLFNLPEVLSLLDSKSGIHTTSYNLEVKLLCSSLAWICLRLSGTLSFCFFSGNFINIVLLIEVFLLEISSELFILTYTIIIYAIYNRFDQYSLTLIKVESDFPSQQCAYKLLVDTIEKYKIALDPVIIISLCCHVPEVMLSIYGCLYEYRFIALKLNSVEFIGNCITISCILLISLMPAIIAGMFPYQAKKITWILHDKLIQERDERTAWEIRRFLQYVGARGCQFRVYGVIPLDASLVGMVASFCVSYLIVIVQFTKLY